MVNMYAKFDEEAFNGLVSIMFTSIFQYCTRGNFRVGVIHIFRTCVFFAKITPTGKLNPNAFMKEIGVVSWKFPPREMSYQHFHEIFPQQK